MKLEFLGTRGYIDAKSRRHRRHSATMLSYRGGRIMLDCGEDWKGRLPSPRPHAVVVTHAHPDHAGGLGKDVDCPVYATGDTWQKIPQVQVPRPEKIVERRSFQIGAIELEAFPVEHSIRAAIMPMAVRSTEIFAVASRASAKIRIAVTYQIAI